jgi:BASS family bile acid:Na+ symporter
MSIDQLINVLVTFTLVELMVAIGLSVTLADVMTAAKNWRLVSKAALANYVCVPAATIALLLAFDTHPMVAVGFLILAVCPGAPFGPPLTAIAKGNVPAAVGLMFILAGSSAVVAPPLLRVLLPWVTGDQAVQIDTAKMVVTLLATQLAPLAVGLAARQWRPALAARLQRPANQLSKVLNLLVIAVILTVQFPMLAQIRWFGFIGMLTLLVVSLTVGWILGGPGSENRKTMALTTSLRNAGVGLVFASSSFPGGPALTAVLAYALIEILGSVLLALLWSRRSGGKNRAEIIGDGAGESPLKEEPPVLALPARN